jgi:hypothetical protein
MWLKNMGKLRLSHWPPDFQTWFSNLSPILKHPRVKRSAAQSANCNYNSWSSKSSCEVKNKGSDLDFDLSQRDRVIILDIIVGATIAGWLSALVLTSAPDQDDFIPNPRCEAANNVTSATPYFPTYIPPSFPTSF